MAVERLSLDRKSSIENEPLTLGVDQLRFAREAAIYVMNSMSVEDALRIFTEGLEPVKEGLCGNSTDSDDEDCCTDLVVPRDIASSPF